MVHLGHCLRSRWVWLGFLFLIMPEKKAIGNSLLMECDRIGKRYII
ncbi:MAG: hypothetical protein J7647_23275 [Cyanobacteria bacterium SBLK]|nr:hypothetical protein [Cyanobacteria bacterium SBLK]